MYYRICIDDSINNDVPIELYESINFIYITIEQ